MESAHVHIRFSNGELDLWYRGIRLIQTLPCPWFVPRPDWTWVLSARAGARADDHFVSNFTMRSSHSAEDIGAVELRVSLNDQDYTQTYAPHHTYFARPALTALADGCVAPSEASCPRAFALKWANKRRYSHPLCWNRSSSRISFTRAASATHHTLTTRIHPTARFITRGSHTWLLGAQRT